MALFIPPKDNRLRNVCSTCHEVLYENPKNVVGVLPIYNNEVLLCQRAIQPQYGYWTIPAGFLEIGETLEQGALREAKEEAGIVIKKTSLFYIYSRRENPHIYMIHTTYLTSMDVEPGIESLECRFFPINNLPWKSIAFSSLKEVLTSFTKAFPNIVSI